MEHREETSLITKTIVITGASSGVGLATAELFAKKGFNIVLAARGIEGLEKAANDCIALGGNLVYKSTDMSLSKEVEDLVRYSLSQFGRIDIWVNNAGVMSSGKFEEIPMEVNEQVIKTNLMGYMHGAYYVLPVFKEQNQGILINNVSIGGFMPAPFSSVYSATKTGIKGLMSGLQSEYSVYPAIHICNIYPQIQRSTGNMHSAKYSGLDFKIPPFAADPNDTAKVIYNLTIKPKNDTFPDASSYLIKFIHGIFPQTFTNLATAVMRLMMKFSNGNDNEGNILYASSDPHQIYGETSIPVPSKSTQRIVSLGILIGLGLYTTTRIRRKYK
ncbi:SDR family NAD(P)-dependent oxidoreductase [Empedobacter falsenii]|uniref:SDR family NAD(P)-dependent oxidoreductase n=1 Tax=Empedobacter falsenii TaxID=343874 RepID=UPI0025782A43|nr:SDR family NAD(P)-dependent oxidoreductase [Empedobacter falsenii]MDM1547061.1 SDR family NAD(P)-dependent oxidoreductase [Empedobacter falsenii]